VATCPACDADLQMGDDLVEHEIIECLDCRSELELLSVSPVLVALAPEIEEDWGE
jgi:alpha-aminoadipate carrier protein LysW